MEITEKLNILSVKQTEVFEAIRDTGAKDESLSRLICLAREIKWFIEELNRDPDTEEAETPEQVEPAKPANTQNPAPAAEPGMTFDVVKAKMVYYQTTHNLDVAALMQSMGYQKLSGIPAERYGELLDKAQKIVDGEG